MFVLLCTVSFITDSTSDLTQVLHHFRQAVMTAILVLYEKHQYLLAFRDMSTRTSNVDLEALNPTM